MLAGQALKMDTDWGCSGTGVQEGEEGKEDFTYTLIPCGNGQPQSQSCCSHDDSNSYAEGQHKACAPSKPCFEGFTRSISLALALWLLVNANLPTKQHQLSQSASGNMLCCLLKSWRVDALCPLVSLKVLERTAIFAWSCPALPCLAQHHLSSSYICICFYI